MRILVGFTGNAMRMRRRNFSHHVGRLKIAWRHAAIELSSSKIQKLLLGGFLLKLFGLVASCNRGDTHHSEASKLSAPVSEDGLLNAAPQCVLVQFT